MASLVQLEYVLALDKHRSFVAAAKASFVTQPTLSMQIQKLEEELDLVLFDRSRKPLVPTQLGVSVIEQIRRVVAEFGKIEQIAYQARGVVAGDYALGIIPTLAPFVLPLFFSTFKKRYPDVLLSIKEMTTSEIIDALKAGHLDGGILATPLGDSQILEHRLFPEPLCLYHSPSLTLPLTKAGKVRVQDLPLERLVMMTEGHCLRTQVIDLCSLSESAVLQHRFKLETSSVSTLTRIVDSGDYFTVLPQLATYDLGSKKREARVKQFHGVSPYREVGLVTYRAAAKAAIDGALSDVLRQSVPSEIGSLNLRHSRRLDP